MSVSEEEPKKKKQKVEEIANVEWHHLKREGLNLSWAELFPKVTCRHLFTQLEAEVNYFTGHLATVKVFGKIHNLPRKQSAYGEPGLEYRYSGTTIPAKPWTPTLEYLRDVIEEKTGFRYNFVLVNRYKDGADKMGFHKDDEKELDPEVPIASLTLGAERDFIFRHQDKRTNHLADEKLVLTNGLLLLMRPPTNRWWYHGLPPRKKCTAPRINLTFRRIVAGVKRL